MAILDAHQRSLTWSDKDLKWFAKKLKEFEVDYVRLFPYWWDERVNNILPHKKSVVSPDLFDLNRINPCYDLALERFANALWDEGRNILFDLFDQCGMGRVWSPFQHNVNGVHGIYEYSDKAITYYKAWIKRIFNILGDKTVYGLGNELYYPAWQNVTEANKWGEKWVLGLTDYLVSLGAKTPITFSADMTVGGTANRIIGWLTETGHYGGGKLIQFIHGMGLPEHWKAVHDANILSANVHFGFSDDGVGVAVIIPPDKQGLCEEDSVRCCANTPWRIKTVQAMYGDLAGKLKIIELLPKEVAMSYKPIRALDIGKSLGIYKKITEQA